MAGAINIVTRRDFQGIETQLHASRPTAAGGDAEQASLLWGSSVGAGHLTVGVDLIRREEIRDGDRNYSRSGWAAGGSFADAEGVSVAGNTFFYPVGEDTNAGYLGGCDTGRGYAGPLTEPYGSPGEGCGFADSDIDWQYDNNKRESVFASADLPVNDDLDIYADARSSRGTFLFRSAPKDHSLAFTPTQRLIDEIRTRYPDFPADFDGMLEVDHRFTGHGASFRSEDSVSEDDFVIGLRGRPGSLPAFHAWARYHNYGFNLTDGVRIGDGIIEEIEAGRYRLNDPFSQDSGHLAAIHRTSMTKNWTWASIRRSAGLSFDGQVTLQEDRGIRWAAGVEHDHEAWKDAYDYRDADNRPVSHEALYIDGDGSSTGERGITSAFAEVVVPVVSGWDVQVNARRDEHDDVGGAFSYQLAGRGEINRNLALRASWGESRRPPFLGQLHYTPYVRRPYACLTEDDCREFIRTYGGNPELELDRAEHLSAGLMADLGPLSLSLDWTRFRISDLPAVQSTQSIVDLHTAGQALPAGFMVTEKNGVIESIEGGYSNSGEIDASGLDLRAHATQETPWGELGMDVYWSHQFDYEYRVLGQAESSDRPRDRLHVATSIRRGGVTAIWNVLARSGVENDHYHYGNWVGHDLLVHWDGAFGLGGLTLTGGVLNIGDRQPGTDSARDGAPVVNWDSARGRTFIVGVRLPLGS